MSCAIQSFPNGSAGSPDGLRPQHLKDLLNAPAGRDGEELLRALASCVNLTLEGKTLLSVQATFFGASLIALRKKDGGMRPVAVGHTLRRLAAKCTGSLVLKSVSAYLAPLQLGYGVSRGVEAAAHTACLYLQGKQSDGLLMLGMPSTH